MKTLAIIFPGFEEEEATAPFALMRRAGLDLTIASYDKTVTGAHNLTYTNLSLLKELDYKEFDALLIPGGPHWKLLKTDKYVHKIITYFMTSNKVVAAICAAPTIIGDLGLLKGRSYTCFTSMNEDFGGTYTGNGVTVDGNLITGKSVAYSIDFAYAIINKLAGENVLNAVYKHIYYEK